MNELEEIVPKQVLEQLYSILLMSDIVSYSDLAKNVDWNSLHILDFFHDEKAKKRVIRWIPEILYSEQRVLAALKFGLWSHEFTKYGACVTNQIYERYIDEAFNYGKYGEEM